MKKFLLFIALLPALSMQSQIVICDTLPIAYVASQVGLHTGIPCGDSAMIIPMVNNTTQGFAYPQGKLINTTSLPPGMSLYTTNWAVFASSWNPGDTMPLRICYTVTQPIPQDYTTTFLLYITNFSPLNVDSCVFANTITVNLNPAAAAVNEIEARPGFSIYPDPVNEFMTLISPVNEQLLLCSVDGKTLRSVVVQQGENKIDVSDFSHGVYFLRSADGSVCRKFVR